MEIKMQPLSQLSITEPKTKALVTVQTTDDTFMLCFREEHEFDLTLYGTPIRIHRGKVKAFQYVMNEFSDHIFIDVNMIPGTKLYKPTKG